MRSRSPVALYELCGSVYGCTDHGHLVLYLPVGGGREAGVWFELRGDGCIAYGLVDAGKQVEEGAVAGRSHHHVSATHTDQYSNKAAASLQGIEEHVHGMLSTFPTRGVIGVALDQSFSLYIK